MLAAVEPHGLALVSSFMRTAPTTLSVQAALAAAAACSAGARTTACIAYPVGASAKSTKTYEFQLPSVTELFGPRALLVSAVRSFAVSFIPLVERYFAALEEAGELEDRGIEPLPVEFPDVRPAVQRAQKAFLREQAVRLCRRGLQQLVKLTQERRTAHQILKNAPASVCRKASRTRFVEAPCWARAFTVGRTFFRSHLMIAGGELIVQQVIIIDSAVRLQPGRARKSRKSALRETVQNLVRAVASCAGASAGAAAIAFLLPPDSKSKAQWPLQAGVLVGDFSASWLVSYFTDAWVAEGDEPK